MTGRPSSLFTSDLTSLTEFGVITPDKPPSSSGFSLARLFRKIRSGLSMTAFLTASIGTPISIVSYSQICVVTDGNAELTEESTSRPNSIGESAVVTKEDVKVLPAESSSTHNDSVEDLNCLANLDPQVAFSVQDPVYTRSLANVLKRVRNILDRRSSVCIIIPLNSPRIYN